jgi:hypothetical protein
VPQLSVSSPTVTEAISLTEDAIDAIMAGRVAGFSDTVAVMPCGAAKRR